MSENDAIYQHINHLSPQERHLLLTALSSSNYEKQDSTGTDQDVQGSALMQNSSENFTSRGNDHSTTTYLDPHLDSTGFDSMLFPNGEDSYDETFLGDLTHADFGANRSQNGGTYPEDVTHPDTGGTVDEDVAQQASASDSPSDEQEGSEKRKLANDAKETDGKKRRGDGTPKKPGRKPLTTEPTSKRKAQNRAAQRAFRERKEKHLKDLESKVESLEKISKDSKNENSILRAQVARLQAELNEYRRRLSWVNNDMVGRTSYNTNGSISSSFNPDSTTTDLYFGTTSVPHSDFSSLTAGISNQHAILDHDTASTALSQTDGKEMELRSSNNPGTTPSLSYSTRNGILSYTTPHRYTSENGIGNTMNGSPTSAGVKPQNIQKQSLTSSATGKMAGSQSKSTSPSSCYELVHSTSSTSSPESISSAILDSPSFIQVRHGEDKTRFDESNTPHSSNQQDRSTPNGEHASTTIHHKPLCKSMLDETLISAGADIDFEQFADQMPSTPDFDWLVQQNHGVFDPTLFGDYRDPQDAYLSHDLDSFINETPFTITGSDKIQDNQPTSKDTQFIATVNGEDDADVGCGTRATSTYQKNVQDLLDKVNEIKRLGQWNEMSAKCKEMLEKKESLMTLPDVWMRITQAEKFQKGDIDVDSLCTQFKTKACCSEKGVLVKRDEFEEIMSSYE
ncbi:DNA-binding transcription factor yap1 [Ascosphaera aggregata]|nr:DNA-binding transcription factor yap1 [Ascosphaera aggregata]